MTPGIPIREVAQFLVDSKRAAGRQLDPEQPIESPALSDAEEEEMAELWSCDRGNQGS